MQRDAVCVACCRVPMVRLLVPLVVVVGCAVMLRVTPLFEALVLRLDALSRHNLWGLLRQVMLVRRGPALCCFDVRLVPLHFKVAHWIQNVMPCSYGLLGRSWLSGRRDDVVNFLKFVALLDGEFLALSRAHLGHELVKHLLLVRLSCLFLALRR